MVYLFEAFESKNTNKATYYTRNFTNRHHENALAYMEKMKISKPDVNINMYQNPTEDAESLYVNGKYYENAKFDITWNTQMEFYPSYQVYTANGLKQKKVALKEYHHKMTKVWKNWSEDYEFETYLIEETKIDGNIKCADYEGFVEHVKEYETNGIPTGFKDFIRLAKQYNCEIPKLVDGKFVFNKV